MTSSLASSIELQKGWPDKQWYCCGGHLSHLGASPNPNSCTGIVESASAPWRVGPSLHRDVLSGEHELLGTDALLASTLRRLIYGRLDVVHKTRSVNVSQCRQRRTEPRPQTTCTTIWRSLGVWFLTRADMQTDTLIAIYSSRVAQILKLHSL